MTQTIPVEEAQARLAELVAGLKPGDEIVLTRDAAPVAEVKPVVPPPAPEPRRFGTLAGTILYMAPDFDDIPEGFEEYLP